MAALEHAEALLVVQVKISKKTHEVWLRLLQKHCKMLHSCISYISPFTVPGQTDVFQAHPGPCKSTLRASGLE